MSTKMSERDWKLALEIFRACLPRVGAKASNDRLFLEALHYFTVHNISWRALPERFGNWNSVWKRFDRLGKSGVFEDYFSILAGLDEGDHLIQMFDSTVIRAHHQAAGAKGGLPDRVSGVLAVASRPRSTSASMRQDCR